MSSVRLGRPTGRNIGGGLPLTPRARSAGPSDVRERERREYSATKARDRDNDYPRDNTGAPTRAPPTRSVRSQRSAANIVPSPGRSPSFTEVPEVPPLPVPRRSDVSSKSSASSGSYSSASASSSTFLDRMMGRSREHEYGSSRTSLEDEADPAPPKAVAPERGGWFNQRSAAAMPESENGESDDGNELLDQSGYGLSLWSRVATATNTLTISVSKAWASNIAAYSGEQTPPGEESRLTRAMKAYHIDKARDPTDLPPWLFEEHERRPPGRPGTSLRDREGSEYDDHDSRQATTPSHSGSHGLRDIYDAAAATSTATAIPSRPQKTRGRAQDDVADVPAPSKASDRLKALRDAKRNAALRNAPVASVQSPHLTGDEWPVHEERGRGYGPDRGGGEDQRHRSPSMPAGVRPSRSGGLPPGRSIRKF